ncbi:MAG: type II toxin-antitoxin system HipA family toxin YjjJ [Burkholderiales bacterium]|nr:type II toxin-antitoxin system HipA family toxin YjjJ [Burkholderiales bacterium]
MTRPHPLTDAALTALRQLGSVATSAELQQRLGVSQPTVSRMLRPLLAAGRVLAVGAARAQRYLLPRPVAGVGTRVPVAEIDAHGQPHPFGTLVPLVGGGYWMQEHHGLSARHPGLPWFLQDMRPQGFLGRTFAQTHPELELPPHINHWSDEHSLKALVHLGDDQPGNLVVGEPALARYLSRQSPGATITDPATDYPRLAHQAIASVLPGSSAGGEQPKFCAVRDGHPVLVKFSPAGDHPADQRWRDLLVCECLALHTLASAGIAAAHSRIVQAAGRVFLESRRFDRTPEGGRLGLVSLEVYDAHYIGRGTNWADTALRTDQAGTDRLGPADVTTICLLEAYGILIGNTDRHHGNISLLLQHHQWRLSPAYDMLPMLYAPISGELVERQLAARPLQPTAATQAVWPQALALARQFWATAAADERISAPFRATAQANLQALPHPHTAP